MSKAPSSGARPPRTKSAFGRSHGHTKAQRRRHTKARLRALLARDGLSGEKRLRIIARLGYSGSTPS